MRTSRVSKDTARILAASRTQRTTRQTRSVTNLPTRAAETITQVKDEDTEAVSSGSDGEARPVKKRKRGLDAPVVVKSETNEVSIMTIASPTKATKVKKARRTPAKKVAGADGSVKMEPPANWEEIYALTREMRNENLAPVDTMGCESLAEENRSPRDRRFQTLIALMLSSQTKDTVNAVAMRGMQERMPGVRILISPNLHPHPPQHTLMTSGLQPRIRARH
jgi:endonuclease-3